MAEAVGSSANKFKCDGCGRSYTWKPELAGRRVKCKCGQVMSVPKESPAAAQDDNDDALYALADIEEKASKNQPVMVVEAPVTPAKPKAKSGGGGGRGGAGVGLKAAGVPLAYQSGPTRFERERGDVTMDMTRDVYAPLVLLVFGLGIYVTYYAVHYHLTGTGIAFTTLGLGIMTAFKAALLIGFALVAAGPLGVSFGSPLTAVLKLAALAVFADGVTTWVDAGVASMAGGAGGMSSLISFPIALAIYWTLLIYLFSMDPGDSWMVVVLLAVFDSIVRWVLLLVLLNTVLSWGGVASSAMPSMGSGSSSKISSQTVGRVNDLKDAKALEEARAFINDGHQALFHEYVEDWYANGCPNVWFVVTRDFNGKRDPYQVCVELPKDKTKRAKCYEIYNRYLDKEKLHPDDPADLKDTGEPYLFVPLR
jgi:hypothetical protein